MRRQLSRIFADEPSVNLALRKKSELYILIHFDTCKNKKKRATTRVYTFWYSLKLSFSGERGTLTAYANTLIINQLCQSVTRQRHELQNNFWQGTLMPKTLLQRFEFRKNPEPTQQFFKLFTCLKIIK